MNTKRKFKIVLVSTGDVEVYNHSLEDLLNTNQSDYEYRFAIDEIIDQVLDLKQYDKITFQPCRDNPDSLGIILRWQ